MNFVVYDGDSGRILRTGVSSSQEEAEFQVGLDQDNEMILVGIEADDETDWVDPSTQKVKSRFDYTLDALPLPCTVEIEEVEYELTEQPPAFEFDAPGEYTIRVDAGPEYLAKEFEVVQA